MNGIMDLQILSQNKNVAFQCGTIHLLNHIVQRCLLLCDSP